MLTASGSVLHLEVYYIGCLYVNMKLADGRKLSILLGKGLVGGLQMKTNV